MNWRAIARVFSLAVCLQLPVSGASAQCDGTWTQRTPAIAPSARYFHAMAYDSARRVTVLFGGFTIVRNAETWEWDGTNWSQKSTAPSLAARSAHALAYDSARGVTVLFGGRFDDESSNETWEWDGTNWSQRTPVVTPSARSSHAMAYDSTRGVTVLFGGNLGGVNNNDGETWEWDGVNGSQKFPATAPSARELHAMAYDSARGVIVLFGGYNGTYPNEMWEWDGTNWSQIFPPVLPLARRQHALAYDVARGVTVLFGGEAEAAGQIADTWEWDGANWTRPNGAAKPSPRESHAMAYDSNRGVTVLFGGAGPGSLNAETWEWAGPAPAVSPGGDCNGNGVLDSCDIAENPALDTNTNGTPDSCEPPPDAACGMCGAGVPMMMPLAMIGLYAVAHRRRSRRASKARRP